MKRIIFLIACAFSLSLCFSQQFTLAVLPDTQQYTDKCAQSSFWWYPLNGMDFYEAQVEYLIKNAVSNGGTISFVLHEGDVVEHRRMFSGEWERASRVMSKLDGVLPYLVVPGNHDYDFWDVKKTPTQISGVEMFDKYFGPDSVHFKDCSWYGGSFNGGTNSWAVQNISGYQVLFLALEVEPTDKTLAWAQSVIDLNSGLPTIIVTHEYLETRTQDKKNPAYLQFADSANRVYLGGNSPEAMWNTFIRKNDQIIMVLCGHSSGEGIRVDVNDYGHNVYAILSDYQGRREVSRSIQTNRKMLPSGDGWLRLMHFDIANSSVHVQTYSPYLERYETDADSDFTINFDFDWKKRFPHQDMRKAQSLVKRLFPQLNFPPLYATIAQ